MLKGRLNNHMRADMQKALLDHAYGGREAELEAEGMHLRNEAIRRLLKPAELKAIETLLPLIYSENGNTTAISWGNDVTVNCGGPTITMGNVNYSRSYHPIDGALPFMRAIRDDRLDLPADDDLAVRVQAWADRCQEFATDRKVTSKQVHAALAAFSTVSQMQSSWPDAIPVVEEILIEHLGRPAPSLPAVVIEEMNAKLRLPPSNDGEEQREAA